MILIPVLVTLVFGRIFCGWICPATLLYELNDNLGVWLRKLGVPVSGRRFNRKFKYIVLATGLVLSMLLGATVFMAFYPPRLVGFELYIAIAGSGFGAGAIVFLSTLFFDLFVARRGFCRYLCPGGALYSLLGKFRLFRIQRDVKICNDCARCNAVCQFGLDPLRDGFGADCNNCSACIQVCPTDALSFRVQVNDQPEQGPGHLGKQYVAKSRQADKEAA